MTKVDRPASRKVFDVVEYGAKADGSTNDRAVVQRAINDAVSAGGGTVLFSKAGTYKIQITSSGWPGSTTLTYANAAAYMGLVINADDIWLEFVPGAVLSFYPYGGDPDTNWALTGESGFAIWRGGGIWITGGASAGSPRRNIRIIGGELDGNFTYTGNRTFPPNTVTGDGWDLTHKGIWLQNDKYFDDIVIDAPHGHHWAGEIVYSSGANLGKEVIINGHYHHTNGDGVSVSGDATMYDNEIHACAAHGIENIAAGTDRQLLTRNHVYDCQLQCIALAVSSDTGGAGFDVFDNPLGPSEAYGIGLYNMRNSQIHHNPIKDCTSGAIIMENTGGSSSGKTRNVQIHHNPLIIDTKNIGVGVNVSIVDDHAQHIAITDNPTIRTQNAIDNGYVFGQSVTLNAALVRDTIDVRNNDAPTGAVTNADTGSAKAIERLLTTTSLTNVVNRKPDVTGIFVVSGWYRVITASTNVTIELAYTDPNGTSRVTAVMALTSKAVGYYELAAITIAAKAGTSIYLNFTAGTANQVYVTASIREA